MTDERTRTRHWGTEAYRVGQVLIVGTLTFAAFFALTEVSTGFLPLVVLAVGLGVLQALPKIWN